MLKQTKRISFRISSVSSKVEADLRTGFGLQRETVPAPKHGHASAVGLQSMSFLDLGSGGWDQSCGAGRSWYFSAGAVKKGPAPTPASLFSISYKQKNLIL